MSAFKIDTWLKKGYTEEEAKYQIKIRRPCNIEYYMHKFGVDVAEAEEMRRANQQKGAKVVSQKPKEQFKLTSPRCVEYWVNQGFSALEAKEKVSEIQSTFSLQKCIDKYGPILGVEVWQTRQISWQNTLNSKSVDDKKSMNSKKTTLKLDIFTNKYGHNIGREKFIECLIAKNCKVFYSLNELENYLYDTVQEFDLYLPLNYFKKKYLKLYYFELFDMPTNINFWLTSIFKFKSTTNPIKLTGKHGNFLYSMVVGKKLLRSSNEILFYNLLIEHGLQLDTDFIIEKYYPNSKMRCDFYIIETDTWIELAGYFDEEYLQKMKYKESTFGSIILYDKTQYKLFIENIQK
jgi:hypothetical protein